ncbi:MAG: response regulator, partial [Desulfosalsimonas sp.]
PTGSETVLVVEDETAILQLTGSMLEKLGYTVINAESPKAALHLAETYGEKIDLLITDVIMPEMNGRALFRQLSACNPEIRALYMSGYTSGIIAQHGVLEKGVQFIQKPFSIRELALKVRQAVKPAWDALPKKDSPAKKI